MILSAAKLMIFLRDNRILLRKMVYAVWRAGLVGASQASPPADAKRQRQGCARGVGLYQQANSAFRLDECIRMRHDYGIDLLVRHRRLIPAGMEAAGIDFPGNLLGLHAVAGGGQEVDYGFFEFHSGQNGINHILPSQ